MYLSKHFWFVGLLSGLFSGLILLFLYFGLNYLTNNYYSVYYIFIYLFPLFSFWLSSKILRDSFGLGVLGFKQSFKLSMLSGILLSFLFSIGVYYIYTNIAKPTIDSRVLMVESDVMLSGKGLSYNQITNKREAVKGLLSPLSIASLYFLYYIVLTPIFALIIAIFAKRKNRFIE